MDMSGCLKVMSAQQCLKSDLCVLLCDPDSVKNLLLPSRPAECDAQLLLVGRESRSETDL